MKKDAREMEKCGRRDARSSLPPDLTPSPNRASSLCGEEEEQRLAMQQDLKEDRFAKQPTVGLVDEGHYGLRHEHEPRRWRNATADEGIGRVVWEKEWSQRLSALDPTAEPQAVPRRRLIRAVSTWQKSGAQTALQFESEDALYLTHTFCLCWPPPIRNHFIIKPRRTHAHTSVLIISSPLPSIRRPIPLFFPLYFHRSRQDHQTHPRNMSIKAASTLGLPPGFTFRPDDSELISLYLLPKLHGEPSRQLFPGVAVIDDAAAANTLPWNLLKRHGLAADDEAYFFVHTHATSDHAKKEAAAARQDRYCDGDGTWVSQRPVYGRTCVDGGEEIEWRRNNLNLHKGRGKNGSGSTGWVMHEYTVTQPACPFLKICHVAFTGHGKDRKRVPDGDEDCQAAGDEPVSKRARVEGDANGNINGSTGEGYCYGMGQYDSGEKEVDQNAEYMFHQEQVVPEEAGELMLGLEAMLSGLEQNILADQAQGGYGTDYATGDVGYDDQNVQRVYRQLAEAMKAEQPRKQAPVIQTTISHHQEPLSSTDHGISPSCCQQLLDGTYLPTTDHEIQDALLQPVQTSSPFPASAGAEFYLEQVPTTEQEQYQPMEHQYGGDQQEQDQELELFWSNIEVDADRIIFPEPFPKVI
ncbi:hypothetical protein HU200_022873 [Digitaria exilis]|uniref:NAC domain-containing protein n=1 Tax=Digitaria exilis TaxID=1010633 RepID=A0A835C607_9POAL|nr:hypothetical protein HU200_022873 [Digitaria exilis]